MCQTLRLATGMILAAYLLQTPGSHSGVFFKIPRLTFSTVQSLDDLRDILLPRQ